MSSPLRLFNTLSGQVEEFQPLAPGMVRMYACGPTVYDYGHIGNFRTFIAVDLLRRFLRLSGFRLEHVMNITDVDDKIIRNAAQQGVSVRDYTSRYERAFLEDLDTLSVERPEYLARATEHIEEMAIFIADLEKKGHAYRADDGSYYFRIATFPGYGKLSKKDFSGMEVGARVDVDEYEKDDARDFALWKSPKPGEAFWQTSIGPGRPGWHIECSTMAMKYLGQTFDIHLGGEDLIFPHHENEIAQSEALTGKPFARYWVHARFLLVEGQKMSKSLNNFFTPRDLVLKGHKPSSLRYLLSSVPYRKQLNFTFDGLRQAASAVERLRNFRARLQSTTFPPGTNPHITALAADAERNLRAALADDMNTAEAQAAIHIMVREANVAADAGNVHQQDAAALLAALQTFDQVFAVLDDHDLPRMRAVVDWARAEGREVSPEAEHAVAAAALSDADIEALIAQRNQARRDRDFARSDQIRDQLAAHGVILEDTKAGVRWKRK